MVLPTWEQGEDGLLAALGIGGLCCGSCVGESNDGEPTCYVYVNGGRDEVEVCCAHVGLVRAALIEYADSRSWTERERENARTYGLCPACGGPRFAEVSEDQCGLTLRLACPNGCAQD